ncbi:hypothetical protein QOT17_010335 [Balamuthia mandrillaris]
MVWQNTLFINFESPILEDYFGMACHPTIEFVRRNQFTLDWWAIRNILDTGSYGAFVLAGGYRVIDDPSVEGYPLVPETRRGFIDLIGNTGAANAIDKWKSIFDSIPDQPWTSTFINSQAVNQIPRFSAEGWKYYLGSTTGGFVAKSSQPYFECANSPNAAHQGRCPRYSLFYSYTPKIATLLDGTGKVNLAYNLPVIPAIWGLAPAPPPSSDDRPERTSNWPLNPATDWIWDHDTNNARECIFFEFNLRGNGDNTFLIDAGCGHVHTFDNPLIMLGVDGPYWMFGARIKVAGSGIKTTGYITHDQHTTASDVFNVLIDTDVWADSFGAAIPQSSQFTMTLEPAEIHKDSAFNSFSVEVWPGDVFILTDQQSWYKDSHIVFGWGMLMQSFHRLSFAHPSATLVDLSGQEIGHVTDGRLRIIYQTTVPPSNI